MREIEPEKKPSRLRDNNAGALRRELISRNQELAGKAAHQVTRRGSTIYQAGRDLHGNLVHGNFMEASWRRILAHPAWYKRLEKAHTSKRQGRELDIRSDSPRENGWRELDSANSSDALLMNLFCYPRVLAGTRLPALLGIERGLEPLFGFKPRVPLLRELVDTTEIDMRLGTLLVEAKLTEAVFPAAPLRKAERYRDLDAVFERQQLLRDEQVQSYQMVRGVLAAHAGGMAFCLICDRRRPEMIQAWEQVVSAVRSFELQARLKVVTWQELAGVMPASVQGWLEKKYGIVTG